MRQILIYSQIVRNKKKFCVDLRAFGKGRKYAATREKAEALKVKLERELIKHGIAGLDLTPRETLEFFEAKAVVEPFGVSLLAAAQFYAANHANVIAKKLGDAAAACVAAKVAANKSKIYTDKLRCNLALFTRGSESLCCGDVTREMVKAWLNGGEWAAWTRKSRLIDLRTFFTYCVTEKWILKSPCDGIDEISVDEGSPGIFIVDEVSRLLCACLTGTAEKGVPLLTMLPYVVLGTFCGIRPSEIERLDWSGVMVARGLVEVTGKRVRSRRRRFVKLEPVAIAWLALCDKQHPVYPKNFWRRHAALCKEAKIEDWPKDGMRHSFASYHYAAFESADLTAAQMGHSSSMMLFENYRELVKKEDAEKFWNLTPDSVQK